MGLSNFSRALRLTEQGESRNGNGEFLIMRDLLDAVRQAAKAGALEALAELRKAETEAEAQTRGSTRIRYFFEWLKKQVRKYTN